MKCDACGAPVENGKCTYCEKVFSQPSTGGDTTNINLTQINYGNYTQPVHSNVDVNRKEKNKTIALLLCIFLGYLGAHKFYEGKVGMGILYLFTMGLFGIGWIVDIIMIAMKPNPYYV